MTTETNEAPEQQRRAASALVKWQKMPNATRYRVFWGTTSGIYPYKHDVGDVSQYRVTGLRHRVAYFFACKAMNATRLSSFSNEVKYRTT